MLVHYSLEYNHLAKVLSTGTSHALFVSVSNYLFDKMASMHADAMLVRITRHRRRYATKMTWTVHGGHMYYNPNFVHEMKEEHRGHKDTLIMCTRTFKHVSGFEFDKRITMYVSFEKLK